MKVLLSLLVFLTAANAFAFQIEGVPFVRQDPEYCGPAALESVMSYYGVHIKQGTIATATYNQNLEGALLTDLENFAHRQGFQTESGQGTTEKIKAFINQRRPVITLLDLGTWVVTKPHYLVLFGYSEKGFTAHDGDKASRLYPYAEFQKMWEKMGCAYLLIYR